VSASRREIWVFGDYRNYFQNRVTLQLLARARELAEPLSAEVAAVIFGHGVDEFVGEYIAHGAHRVLVTDHPDLHGYNTERYAELLARLARERRPEIILIGATDFGREFAPQVSWRLQTGLTADCINLEINADGLLVQTAPSFGGNLIAQIVTPKRRPQMATVRPGTFPELPHDYEATGEIVPVPLPDDLPAPRVRLVKSEPLPAPPRSLEDAPVVVCGGRGMGSKAKFKKLFELARLMEAEVGATRPVVHGRWIDADALVGQAGRQIKPKVLFSFGISGAIQHTAATNEAEFVIAVNKNPAAAMMQTADVAIVADANQFCSALIRELKGRIRE
jgi:electron transfer flavoprotein alpha subunit